MTPAPTSPVEVLSDPEHFAESEARYRKLRQREGRLLDDAVVAALPRTPAGFPHRYEWRVRAHGLQRLMKYLRVKHRPLEILDLGCGNGWLAAKLARLEGVAVTALDIHSEELAQAARVFRKPPRPRWVLADVFEDVLPREFFDLILLAGVLSYFPDAASLVRRCLELLRSGGELHILENPLFADAEREAARRRSEQYLRKLGVPEMVGQYHYHRRNDLDPFQPEILHNPKSLSSKFRAHILRRPVSPFPWLRIRK